MQIAQRSVNDCIARYLPHVSEKASEQVETVVHSSEIVSAIGGFKKSRGTHVKSLAV